MTSFVRPLVALVCCTVALAACAPGALTHDLAQPPSFEPAKQTKCAVTKSQARPLIVEWPASDRAALESQARRGRVVVRYSGCELEVLRGCQAPGSYSYTALTPKRETVSIHDQDELYAHMPVHAASFEGALERNGQLEVSMTIVGMFESLTSPPSAAQLEGACDGATHVISALTIGAFEFYAGAGARVEAGGGVLGVKAGGKSESRREELSFDGDDGACRAASRDDDHPPDGCGGLLRIEVVPVLSAAPRDETGPVAAKTEAPKEGPEAEPKAVDRVDAEPPATLAPEDEGFVDDHGGAGWGNRCFAHARAGRLESARAACHRGLAVRPSPAIRGAILYSLAVIEEQAGDRDRACDWLKQSLEARPGNAPTLNKRDGLGC